MKDRHWLVVLLLSLGTILFVYHRWFMGGALSAPDFTFLYSERLGEFSWLPNAWSETFGNGTGGATFASLNLNLYLHMGIRLLVFVFDIPWSIASRIMFFWPFLLVGSMGAYYFVQSVLKRPVLGVLGSLVYMTNTYILMIAGGGQIGLMMAYAVAPFVFGSVIRKDTRVFTVASVFFILFDIRYAYIVYAAILLYGITVIPFARWQATVRSFIPSILWIIAANLFWFIPLIFAPSFGLPDGYGDPGWLKYLSWADFSKTLSLLHPNWPENIFGKTYFMRPEFILLPFIAFIPLLLVWEKKTAEYRHYLFFAALLLIGAFLAKGVNPPFGDLYNWLFVHVPLFNGFRDPTKFYLLSAISYTILLPFSLEAVEGWLSKYKRVHVFPTYLPFMFVLFWSGILLLPFWKGELRGTFEKVHVGGDYPKLEKLVVSDTDFYRTVSVPWRQRFLFQSERHPLMNASDVFKTSDMDAIEQGISDPAFERTIRSLAVRYIVVPQDSMEEIFLTERTYDPKLRERFVTALDKIPYLTKNKDFTDIAVYEYKKQTGHFYYELKNLDFVRQKELRKDATHYLVDIDTSMRPMQLIFSEAYDPAWKLWDGKKFIASKPTPTGLNSFLLDSHVTSRVSVQYGKDRLLMLSYGSTAGVIFVLAVFWLLKSATRRSRKKIATIIFMVAAVVGVVGIRNNSETAGILSDKNIRYSPQWQKLADPLTGAVMRGARFGGSQIHFLVSNTSSLALTAESANKETNEQILDVRVNGVSYVLASPFAGKSLAIPINSPSVENRVSIDITLYCDSAMIPCDVRITGIEADRGAVVLPPRLTDRKTIAILGDSITSSFGKDNYSHTLADRLGFSLHNAAVFGSSVTPVPGWDSGLLRVTDDIVVYKPDTIVLFIGTNDLGRSVPIAEFRKNYEALISKIRQGSPASQIIAIGLLTRKDFSSREIRLYSDAIQAEAKKAGIEYLDPYGWLSDVDLQDVVHPSKASQNKLASKMYDELARFIRK